MSISTELHSRTRHSVPPTEPGQRVILPGVSWTTYVRLLTDFEDSHTAHFTYNGGVLEIMVLSARHENLNRTLALLVEIIAEEMGIDIRRFGSMTLKREDLNKGFEPDSCYYINHEAQVRGKDNIDLSIDPPPDLVIEIDITSPSLDKFPIYAQVGVSEVWRYDGNTLNLFVLESGQYQSAPASTAFPLLTSGVANQFLATSITHRSTAWLRQVRQWVREQRGTGEA